MKITLFGSTGRTGREFLKRCMENGHYVTVLVRDKQKLDLLNLKPSVVLEGNTRNEEDVLLALQGSELAVSCLATDGDDTLSVSMKNIAGSMKQLGLTRLLTVGTAGILQSRISPELFRFQSTESKRRLTRASEEHLSVFSLLQEADLDWMIACPTYLPDGELTGSYRREVDFLPIDGKSISVQDTADFLYNEMLRHTYSKKRVGLSY